MNVANIVKYLDTFLSPHPWALFEIVGEVNDILRCTEQRRSQYKQADQVPLFELEAILRILLKKSEVCSAEIVDQILAPKNDQIGIILKWEIRQKWFLVCGPFQNTLDEEQILQGVDGVRAGLSTLDADQPHEEGRLFPRYSIGHLPATIDIEDDFRHVKALEVGTTGLKLESSNDLTTIDKKAITLKIKDQIFHMNLLHAWSKKINDKFVGGFTVTFDNKENFEKWFVFTKALHRIALKKRSPHATP